MLAKPTIYRESVIIYSNRNRKHIRVPVGIKSDKLNANGLLNKGCGYPDFEEKNQQIKDKLKEVQTALDAYPEFTSKEIMAFVKNGTMPSEPEPEPEVKPLSFLECYQRFVIDSETGVRLSDKETELSPSTIKGYKSVLTNLTKFAETYDLTDWNNIDYNFYKAFCNYYWNTLKCYDNYTGKAISIIITSLGYAKKIKLIPAAIDVSGWKVWKEDIEILVIYKDEIRLLNQMPITVKLERSRDMLERTRDIFLMGCFTCLRVENLLALTERDLVIKNGEYYINTLVPKINKVIQIKLNPIGMAIINKYRHQYRTLLPNISSIKFNENLKALAAEFKKYLNKLNEVNPLNIIGNNWNNDFKRVRTRKGKHHFEYVDPAKYISSHCMRRSGITNLLMLNLNTFEVSAISGHSQNSKDFGKYVKIAQQSVEKKSVDAWTSVFA